MKKLSLLFLFTAALLLYSSIPQKELYEIENSGYLTDPVASDHGIIYSNNLGNALYIIRDGEFETLYENPGCGRYISVHGTLLGFKDIDTETGFQAPALLNIGTREVVLLEKMSEKCGQISFSDDGTVVYTFGNELVIRQNSGQSIRTGLGYYTNTAVISPDGKHIAISGKGQSIVIYNTVTGDTYTAVDDKEYISLKWSPGSDRLSFTSISGELKVLDIRSGSVSGYGMVHDHTWADSGSIVFSRPVHNEKDLISSEIFIADINSGTVRALTSTPEIYEMFPVVNNGMLFFNSFGKNTVLSGKFTAKGIENIRVNLDYTGKLELRPVLIRNSSISKELLNVPYINQVYHTDSYGHRYGCCAAT